jgi:hypothetical protein
MIDVQFPDCHTILLRYRNKAKRQIQSSPPVSRSQATKSRCGNDKRFFNHLHHFVLTAELYNDIGNSFKAFIYLLLVTLGKKLLATALV